MLFHHLYLFQAAFSCHPLKFGLIRACNKDCMQGSGEGWGALCSNPKLEMFAEAHIYFIYGSLSAKTVVLKVVPRDPWPAKPKIFMV